MTGTIGPETSKLLAEVAGLPTPEIETPEARLARLAVDPLAVFAELNLRSSQAPQLQTLHPETRARIAVAMAPATEPVAITIKPDAIKIVHVLKATAPVIAPRTYKEEKAAPFQPSASDRSEAIEMVRLDRYFPALAIVAAVTTAFLLWLLI